MGNLSLSKFDPLPRILFADDFNTGYCGWTELIGNYEDTLDTILPGFADCRPPMLSTATMWDTGTAGALDGTYSLKLATRPREGYLADSLKRITYRCSGLLQLECFLAAKPEASELQLSELDVRVSGVMFDLQNAMHHVMLLVHPLKQTYGVC